MERSDIFRAKPAGMLFPDFRAAIGNLADAAGCEPLTRDFGEKVLRTSSILTKFAN